MALALLLLTRVRRLLGNDGHPASLLSRLWASSLQALHVLRTIDSLPCVCATYSTCVRKSSTDVEQVVWEGWVRGRKQPDVPEQSWQQIVCFWSNIPALSFPPPSQVAPSSRVGGIQPTKFGV